MTPVYQLLRLVVGPSPSEFNYIISDLDFIGCPVLYY